jgi:uncharacterized protein (DUF885 family)
MGNNNNDKKNYFNEYLELNPLLKFKLKIIKKIKTIENVLDCNYIKNYKKLLNKYKNSDDYDLSNMVRLFLKMDETIDMNLMPITSFENEILDLDNRFRRNKIIKKKINEYVNSCIDNMREGIRQKITLPKIICKDLIKQIEKTNHSNLLKFLKNEYYKKCRGIDKIGLCYLRNGRKYYKLLIKYFCNGAYMSPIKIHNNGKRLVKKFNKIQKNYYTSEKEILEDVKKYYDIIINEIIPINFHYSTINNECKIRKVPKNLESTNALAYYEPDTKIFYLNFKYHKEINKNSLKTLIMHESDPGHHYQFSYFSDYKKLPLHKIYTIDNIAFEEGWALYAEKLGDLKYNEYGEYEQLRIVRLVVDTGINYYGWSYMKAFNYMKNHLTSLSTLEINNEITRYICNPGQALAYKIGERFIIKLRNLYINKYKLGDIKDFHDFILEDGVVSFKYLMNKLKTKYITDRNY